MGKKVATWWELCSGSHESTPHSSWCDDACRVPLGTPEPFIWPHGAANRPVNESCSHPTTVIELILHTKRRSEEWEEVYFLNMTHHWNSLRILKTLWIHFKIKFFTLLITKHFQMKEKTVVCISLWFLCCNNYCCREEKSKTQHSCLNSELFSDKDQSKGVQAGPALPSQT